MFYSSLINQFLISFKSRGFRCTSLYNKASSLFFSTVLVLFKDATRQNLWFPSPLPPTPSQQCHPYLFIKQHYITFFLRKTAVILSSVASVLLTPSSRSLFLHTNDQQQAAGQGGRGRGEAGTAMWQVRLCHEALVIKIAVRSWLKGFDALRHCIIPSCRAKPKYHTCCNIPKEETGIFFSFWVMCGKYTKSTVLNGGKWDFSFRRKSTGKHESAQRGETRPHRWWYVSGSWARLMNSLYSPASAIME